MSFRSRSNVRPANGPPRRASSLTRDPGSSNSYHATSERGFNTYGSLISLCQKNYSFGSNQNLRSTVRDHYGNDHGSDFRNSFCSTYLPSYKDGKNKYTRIAQQNTAVYSPYYARYENGVTTASLSIPRSSVTRDFVLRSKNLLSSSLSGSGGAAPISENPIISVANIGRSQSLRALERKSRSRKCREAVKAAVPDTLPAIYDQINASSQIKKSLSSLTLESDGYEVNLIIKIFSVALYFIHICS